MVSLDFSREQCMKRLSQAKMNAFGAMLIQDGRMRVEIMHNTSYDPGYVQFEKKTLEEIEMEWAPFKNSDEEEEDEEEVVESDEDYDFEGDSDWD